MNRLILHLKRKIEINLQSDWKLANMAESVSISKSQLTKLFQTEIGCSPAKYVKNIRLEKACELLENSFLRIKEIIFVAGIGDQSHFVRDFKAQYGVTPTEYRYFHLEKLESKKLSANK